MFRHYITTRFNEGIYGPNSKLKIPPEKWMEHRLRLFTSFTFPSIMEQTCQNFMWLVLMDRQTPDHYIQEIESFRYPNIKLLYRTKAGMAWTQAFEPGDYDLINTRIDNDDALHRDAVEVLQQTYLNEYRQRTKPWVMVFPFGLIMDLASQDLCVMEYWLNNCPTRVGDRSDGKTIHEWRHDEIPPDVERCYIGNAAYWLQIVHTHNVLNGIPVNGHPHKILHREITASLQVLTQFGVTPDRLPVA